MRSAVREFVKNGYARAKTGDIANGAGISKGSIFQYFGNKKELFVYCAGWGLDTFMKKLEARVNIGDMDVFEYFRDTRAQSGLIAAESELAGFMKVVMNEPGLHDDTMKSMYEVGNAYIEKLIQNGKDRGTVRLDVENSLLTDYFSAITERFIQRWMRLYIADFPAAPTAENEKAMKKELDQMIDLLKKGMGASECS